MRIGLMAPTLLSAGSCDLPQLRTAAEKAEEYGVEVLWVGDHLLWHLPMLDAVTTLGALATLTERTMIGTNVLQLPLRRPLDVAKAFATLSHLTGGRVFMGVGVGGEFEPEWTGAGVDVHERGRRCDEALLALDWFWNGEQRQGTFFSSPGVAVTPAPAAHIPVWVGGRSDAAVRRAARHDGYLGVWLSPPRVDAIRQAIDVERGGLDGFRFGLQLFTRIGDDAARAQAEALDSMTRTYGIDAAPFARYVAAGSPEEIAARCLEYAEAGVDHLSFFLTGQDWNEQVRRLGEEVLPLIAEGGTS